MAYKTWTASPENNLRLRCICRWEDTTDGVTKARSGLSVTAFIAATSARDATAIHPSLSTTLGEVGATGKYLGSLLGASLTAVLDNATYWDQLVYVIYIAASFRVVVPVYVRRVRESDDA